jgi:hypothetical protein
MGHVAHMGELRNACSILVGRPGCRWEDNLGMCLKEIGWQGVDWIYLSQYRVQ